MSRSSLFATALLVLAISAPAGAQKVKAGAASGTAVSASSTSGGLIITVPQATFLVVTQFCSEDLRSFRVTDGLNTVIPSWIDFTRPCIDYSPGIVVSAGTGLYCTSTGAFGFGTTCLLNGILTK